MASIDMRTRRRRDVRPLSASTVRTALLPELLERNGPLAGQGVGALGVPPLTITAAEERFVLSEHGGTLSLIDAVPGPSGIVVTLDEDALSDLVQDVTTLAWATMMGRLTLEQGSLQELARWDPILRALRDGVPVFEPGALSFRGRDGTGLDLQRGYRLHDDPDEVGTFLAQTGYLHLCEVFGAAEMAAVSTELEQAIATAERDDGRSWWARTDEGWYPSRILGFNRSSPTLRELLRSERFGRIAHLVEDVLVQSDVEETDMAEGLLKKVGVVEGISDVSWHKDCGPGGHSYGCCGLTVGIQLTSADRHTGELGVMAGSNRANVPGLHIVDDFGLPRIALPTAVGDCTIHCSCTLHMSRPPETAERRVVYTGFALAPLPDEAEFLPSENDRRRNRAALDLLGRGTAGRDELDRLPLGD